MANFKSENNKQIRRINFRLTEDEYQKLSESASVFGLSTSAYAKQIALKSKLRKPYFTLVEARAIYKEINQHGNNLNQIARKLNQGNPATQELLEEVRQAKEMYKRLWLQLQK